MHSLPKVRESCWFQPDIDFFAAQQQHMREPSKPDFACTGRGGEGEGGEGMCLGRLRPSTIPYCGSLVNLCLWLRVVWF